MLIERLVIRPLYARPLDAILATWGLGIVIGQLITIGFGREVQFVQSPVSGAIPFLGQSYSLYRLLLVVAAVALGGALAALLYFTRFGLTARAVIMNEDLARGLGIDSDKVRLVTFGLGAALAEHGGRLDHAAARASSPTWACRGWSTRSCWCWYRASRFVGLGLASLILGGAAGGGQHLPQPGDRRPDHRRARRGHPAHPAAGAGP